MKYIAMLRGINVSGQKKVKMADLRKYLTEAGLKNVQTYIQSGNIIFEHAASPAAIENLIQEKINKEYGFKVQILVKTPKELKEAIKNNLFLKDPAKDDDRVYFTFLSEKPKQENLDQLANLELSPEEYFIDDKNVYLYVPNGYGKAKLNNNFIENKLKVSATSRNLKTVRKLIEMTSG